MRVKATVTLFFTMIAIAVFAHFHNNNNYYNNNNNEETKLKMSIFLMKFNETQNNMT